jgi:hypothetical protein
MLGRRWLIAVLIATPLVAGCVSTLSEDATADLRPVVRAAPLIADPPVATTQPVAAIPQRQPVDRTVLVMPYDPGPSGYEIRAEENAAERAYLEDLRFREYEAAADAPYLSNYRYYAYGPGPYLYGRYYYRPSYYGPYWSSPWAYGPAWSHYPYYRSVPTYVDRYRYWRDWGAVVRPSDLPPTVRNDRLQRSEFGRDRQVDQLRARSEQRQRSMRGGGEITGESR